MVEANEKVAEFIHEISGSQGENEAVAPTTRLFLTRHLSSLSKVLPASVEPSGQWAGFAAGQAHVPQPSSFCCWGCELWMRTDYLAYLTALFLIYKLEDEPRIYLLGY